MQHSMLGRIISSEHKCSPAGESDEFHIITSRSVLCLNAEGYMSGI